MVFSRQPVAAAADDWQDKPFIVAKVLATVPKSGSNQERFVLQWYGNRKGAVKGPHRPGFLDKKDNKLVFAVAPGRGFKPWSNTTTGRHVTMEDLLMIQPKLTKTATLASESLELLAACPEIDWSVQVQEEGLFQ